MIRRFLCRVVLWALQPELDRQQREMLQAVAAALHDTVGPRTGGAVGRLAARREDAA